MNRLASLLAGGVTAAVSGAVIAAAAVGQGVFDSPSKPQPKQDQVAATSTWTDPTAAAAAQEPAVQAVQPRIVYVDKDPIVVTQTYQQPVAGSAAMSTETPSSTPPPAGTPAGATSPKGQSRPAEPPAPEPRAQQPQPAAGNAQPTAKATERPERTATTAASPTTTAPTQPGATASARPREDDHRTSTANGGEHERD